MSCHCEAQATEETSPGTNTDGQNASEDFSKPLPRPSSDYVRKIHPSWYPQKLTMAQQDLYEQQLPLLLPLEVMYPWMFKMIFGYFSTEREIPKRTCKF